MLFDLLQRSRFTIVTDGEPDDVIALLLLQRAGKLNKATIIVCGWKDPQNKAAHLYETLDLSKDQIFVGESSDLDFSYGPLAHVRHFPKWRPEMFTDAFILCLAPPHELLMTDHSTLKSSTLAIYGSFNVRGISVAPMHALLAAFQSVIYYETFFAVGTNNVIHEAEVIDRLPDKVIDLILLWNEHSKSYGDKIAYSIAVCPRQFVNADTGLVATLLIENPACKLVHSRLKWGLFTSYEVAASRIQVVVGAETDEFRAQQVDWMITLLQ